VTIGLGESPERYAILQLKDNEKQSSGPLNAATAKNGGLLLPRVELEKKYQLLPFVTQAIVDANDQDYQDSKLTHTGLIVYNLVENDDEDLCLGLNQWDGEKWDCFQSKMGNAAATIDNCESLSFVGQYKNNVSLGTGNYMTITLNVTKAGAYTITATPDPANGYYFNYTGVFLTTGVYSVMVPGAGTPLNYTPGNSDGDLIKITFNGKALENCDPLYIKIEDSSVKPIYTMSCGSTKVKGVYQIDKELETRDSGTGEGHYLEVTLNVDNTAFGAKYVIETNTVDGIYFKGEGLLITSNQTVYLQGYGIPTSMEDKIFTITSNSSKSVATCSATVYMCYTKKRILGIGYYNNEFGYHLQEGSGPYKVLTASQNFGTDMNSIVKVDGFEFDYIDGQTQSNISALTGIINQTALDTQLAKNPDIIFVGYYLNFDAVTIQKLLDYTYKGGVLILFSEVYILNASTMANVFMKTLFGDNGVGFAGQNAAGDTYQFSGIDDELLVGPFGDLRGKLWGEDASTTLTLTGIPSGNIITYSGANAANLSTTYSGVSMFRHGTLNLFWCGDAGFISNNNAYVGPAYANLNICPFAMDASFNPITRTNFRGGAVENARFFCNLMAWALKQAEFNGINTP